MKVKDVMTPSPVACTPTNTLADAAGIMWNSDCGILPVVDEGGKVMGVITDRDICMSALFNARPLAHIAVEEVVSGKLLACKPQDDVRVALQTMGENKVRRLPVVNVDGTLDGLLSMNDIVLRVEDGRDKHSITYADVIKAYKGICTHQLPIQTKAAGV